MLIKGLILKEEQGWIELRGVEGEVGEGSRPVSRLVSQGMLPLLGTFQLPLPLEDPCAHQSLIFHAGGPTVEAHSQGQVGGRSRAEEASEPASEPGEGVGLRPVTELKIVLPLKVHVTPGTHAV